MSGKVDGFAPRVQVPSSTTTQAPAPAATPAPAPAASPVPATVVAQPATAFDASAPPRRFADSQTGAPVPTSANPHALWGEGHGHGHGGVRGPDGQPLTPEQIAARQAQMQQQIGDRVDHLKDKWRYTRNTTKTNELWNYAEDSKKMPPDVKAKLEAKLWKTDRDQARLDRLQEQAKQLGSGGGTPEQRTDLAHQIESAKKAISTDLSDANTVIKDAGLEADHLAHAESTIDPNAAKDGETSLADMLAGFLKFTGGVFGFDQIDDLRNNWDDNGAIDDIGLMKVDRSAQLEQINTLRKDEGKVKDRNIDRTELENLKRYGVKTKN
jgi:hypothetical protein